MQYRYHFPHETVIGDLRNIIYYGINRPPELARRFHIGYLELAAANPELNLLNQVNGEEITLPTSWILPEVMGEGILINLAEMRLYFFHPLKDGRPVVSSFPIGIGRPGYDTPTGDFAVEMKLKDPTWYPNKSSRLRNPELPIEVPPGPNNPLGEYWIQLSLEGYGLHSTNRPESIGKKISLGCIRLFPENMGWLFARVKAGMPVRIINMPVKFGMREGVLYVEVHRNGFSNAELEKEAFRIKEEQAYDAIDDNILRDAIHKATGIPVPINKMN
ncbi:MAG: L,D-transpeptidase family protein [bacterium]|nr:L,D-transpeptidase family protein [bacterium]